MILITLTFFAVVVHIWSTVMIYKFLKKRKEEIASFLFINFFIFKYLKDYRTITKRTTGRTGYLYYTWIGSINLALLCVLLIFLSSNKALF